MTLEEKMEKIAAVELYFNGMLQRDIKETMDFFVNKDVARAGIAQTLTVELYLLSKKANVSKEQVVEMIEACYDEDVKHIEPSDYE